MERGWHHLGFFAHDIPLAEIISGRIQPGADLLPELKKIGLCGAGFGFGDIRVDNGVILIRF